MKIGRFEDIEAWQIRRDLCRLVYDAAKKERFSKDYGLKDQKLNLSDFSLTPKGSVLNFNQKSMLPWIRIM
jgi:hypothetical protein